MAENNIYDIRTGKPMDMNKLPYNKDHIDVYDKLMKAFPIKEHIKKTIKHRDAWAPALKILEGKEVEHIDEGIELLTDALIQYRKSAGIVVSDKAEDRHQYIMQVRAALESLKENAKGELSDPESMLKKGEGHLLLMNLLETERKNDLEGKIDYEMRKILPSNKGFDFYHGMANYMAALDPKKKYSKGEIASLARYENLMANLRRSYQVEADNQLKDYKPEKKKDAGKDAKGATPVNKAA